MLYPELDFPKYIHIETIRACNSRCPFCAYGSGEIINPGPMSEDLYQKIEAELAERAAEITRVTPHILGEPLLDPKMAKRVARLKEKGIREVSIASNVSLLDEKKATDLLTAGLDILRMSITTINPKKYRLLREGLDFETVLRNARRYFELRDQINPKSVIYVHMERAPMLTDDDVEEWRAYWKTFVRPGDMLKISELFDLVRKPGAKAVPDGKRRPPCQALMQSFTIANKGEAPLCCGDFKGGEFECLVGNVNADSIADIWRGTKFKNFRELHRAGKRDSIPLCMNCDIWGDDAKKNYVEAIRSQVEPAS